MNFFWHNILSFQKWHDTEFFFSCYLCNTGANQNIGTLINAINLIKWFIALKFTAGKAVLKRAKAININNTTSPIINRYFRNFYKNFKNLYSLQKKNWKHMANMCLLTLILHIQYVMYINIIEEKYLLNALCVYSDYPLLFFSYLRYEYYTR